MIFDRSVTVRSNGTSTFAFNKSDKGGGADSADDLVIWDALGWFQLTPLES
jgi:hypothetical protein